MESRKLQKGRPRKRAGPAPKKTMSIQTDNPSETAFGQLKWRVEDTCFGEVLRAPDGHTLLPPGLFEEVSEHMAQLTKRK